MSKKANFLLKCDARKSLLSSVTGSGAVRSVTYHAFGWREPRASAAALGFNGQRIENLTGCYHLGHGHRVYNPAVMRFYSPDSLSPFGKGGLNAYTYCVGDPVNYQDPSGQFIMRALARLNGVVGDVLRLAPRAVERYGPMAGVHINSVLTAGVAAVYAYARATHMNAKSVNFVAMVTAHNVAVTVATYALVVHARFTPIAIRRVGQALEDIGQRVIIVRRGAQPPMRVRLPTPRLFFSTI